MKSTIIGLTLLAAGVCAAEEKDSVFAGTIADSARVDTLATYVGASGLDVKGEAVIDNKKGQEPSLYRIGARTPFVGPVRAVGAVDVFAEGDNSWTGFTELKLGDFALRAGAVQDAPLGLMGLGGLRYDGEHLFGDVDAVSNG